jgi:hypothetical protein
MKSTGKNTGVSQITASGRQRELNLEKKRTGEFGRVAYEEDGCIIPNLDVDWVNIRHETGPNQYRDVPSPYGDA